MASDNAGPQNNEQFKLSSLFDVKDKVALVTGRLRESRIGLGVSANASKVVPLGLA